MVFSAVVAVVPTFATAFKIVVEKFELLDIALANSTNVFNAAGAAPTRFDIALLTNVWVAKVGNCDVRVELIFPTEVFKLDILVACELTVPSNAL